MQEYEKHQLAEPVDSDAEPAGDANVGDVVDVTNSSGNRAFSVCRRRSAALDVPSCAGGPAAAAAAQAAAAAAPAVTAAAESAVLAATAAAAAPAAGQQ